MRALIVSCLGFGGGIGLLVGIAMVIQGRPDAFQFGLQAGLVLGGIFAVMLVGVFLPLDLFAHLFLNKPGYKEIWELKQSREVTFEGSLKDAIATCRRALLSVPYIGTVSEDIDTLSIQAKTGTSWRSFGERLEVRISRSGDNAWTIRCTSASPTESIIFDYGKNFDNVETWQRTLNRLQEEQKSQVA